MTRFAWLQSRTQILGAAVALAALALVAAVTGPYLGHLYATTVAPCQARGDCQTAVGEFLSHDGFLRGALPLLLLLVPALLGIFWGAPLLARELETGTFRLAWTQSVTRSRWLTGKLLLAAAATALVAGLASLTVTWWLRAPDLLDASRFSPPEFDERGVVAIGYAVFAVMLGALAGAVIRRTLPAMAATLAGFVGVRLAVVRWVRPHLLAPLHQIVPLRSASSFGFTTHGSGMMLAVRGTRLPNAWVYSTQLVTGSGHVATEAERAQFVHQYCPALASVSPVPGPGGTHVRAVPDAAFKNCIDLAGQRFHLLVAYQPPSRYWAFQWLETGVFLALALLAAAACFWWVRRRLS
ncbi:MAG: ABC transporter permease subunit [Frankiaceae bacterium]